MFKITPIQDEKEQEIIAKACKTVKRDGFFAYKMIDVETGELMGFSQFEILGTCAFISDIKAPLGYDDFEAMFILAKSTMNFIDTCGAHLCKVSESTAEERLLLAVGFKNYECDTTGMFDGSHCSGHK